MGAHRHHRGAAGAVLLRPADPGSARRSTSLGDGLFVAGDHRDTPSIQGALVSGRRAAGAVLRELRAARRGVLSDA